MPSYCSAYGCKNSGFMEGISFHSFPLSNKNILIEWLGEVKRENFVPTKYSKICSEHFEEDCFTYEKFTGRRLLKPNVVPTKFSFSKPTNQRKKDSCQMRNKECISCCIPGCHSKSFRKLEHSLAVGEKHIFMFLVPNDDRLFNKWKEAVKGTDYELTKDDYICEYHFLENHIERFCRTSDNIEKQKRIPTLKCQAVPIKFLKAFQKTKDISTQHSDFQNSAVISSVKGLSDKSNLAFDSCDSRNCELEIVCDSSIEIKEKSVDSSVNCAQRQMSNNKKSISYSELVKNIQLVKKPSVSWSVVCTDQFTIFARWNTKFIAEKRIVIESSLKVRVFLNDWELEMTDLVDITSLEDVSSLLEKMENYNID